MRQQPITKDTWTEAEAMSLVRGRPTTEDATTGRTRAVLARTFHDEVIPRLLMARRQQAALPAAGADPAPGREQVAELSALVIRGTDSDSAAYVQAMHDRGTSAETITLDLLAPTARHLGRMWEEDACSFGDVTLGTLRLGNMLRLLSGAFAGDTQPLCSAPRALLAQMPGEQHGLGLAIVVQFFRRSGWHVRAAQAATGTELTGMVAGEWVNIVGLSVACSDRMDSLATHIRAIRRASRNPKIGVLVGGPVFVAHPHLSAMVGADATAADGKQAVQQAQSLVSLLAREQ
jgi:methanogenic corrinoid protein MtbC1